MAIVAKKLTDRELDLLEETLKNESEDVDVRLSAYFSVVNCALPWIKHTERYWIPVIKEIKDQNVLMGIAEKTLDEYDEDYELRMAAIENISDQTFLTWIATNEKEQRWVRIAAMQKISDQNILLEILQSKDSYVREAAVGRISDKKNLIEIAKTNPDFQVRQAAVSGIFDQKALIDIAKNNDYDVVRQFAIGRINDPRALKRMAKHEKVEWVRLYAKDRADERIEIEKIYRPKRSIFRISEIFEKDEEYDRDEDTRCHAVEYKSDKSTSIETEINDTDSAVIETSFEKEFDQSILKEETKRDLSKDQNGTADRKTQESPAKAADTIQRHFTDDDARKFFKEYADKESFLTLLSVEYLGTVNGENESCGGCTLGDGRTCWPPTHYIDEFSVISEREWKCGSGTVCCKRFSKLSMGWSTGEFDCSNAYGDYNTIKHIKYENADREGFSSYEELLTRLTSECNDKNMRLEETDRDKAYRYQLIWQAIKHPDYKMRIAAIDCLSDQDVLIEIAKTDSENWVRWAAVRHISDQTALIGITQNDKDSWVRMEAAGRIIDQMALIEIAKTVNDYNVRNATVGRINDQSVLIAIAKTDRDEHIRMAAVERISDPRALNEIAKTDEDYRVRRAAVNRINDQSVLIEIAKTDRGEHIRMAAVERISDPRALNEISETDKDPKVQIAAVKRFEQIILKAETKRDLSKEATRSAEIMSQESSAKAANTTQRWFKDDGVRKFIKEYVDEECFLTLLSIQYRGTVNGRSETCGGCTWDYRECSPPVHCIDEFIVVSEREWKCGTEIVRCKRYSELSMGWSLGGIDCSNAYDDYDTIKHIKYENAAGEGFSSYEGLISRLTSEYNDKNMKLEETDRNIAYRYQLIWQATKHPDENKRRAAIDGIIDQDVLTEIAKTDKLYQIRAAAAVRISDRTVLTEIAKNDKDSSVRKAAVSRIIDLGTLIEILKTDKDVNVKRAAVERITDQIVLIGVVRTEEEYLVRWTAVDRITDQRALKEIAKTDQDERIRRAAVERISDHSALIEIANTDVNVEVRLAAIRPIRDQRALIDIAKTGKYPDVRTAAVERVTDQSVLIEIAKTDKEASIRKIAVERIWDRKVAKEIEQKYIEPQNLSSATVKSISDKGASKTQ